MSGLGFPLEKFPNRKLSSEPIRSSVFPLLGGVYPGKIHGLKVTLAVSDAVQPVVVFVTVRIKSAVVVRNVPNTLTVGVCVLPPAEIFPRLPVVHWYVTP